MTSSKPMSMAKSAPAKKRRKGASLQTKKQRAGWIFVLPFIIGLVLIYAPIIINSIRISFSSFRIIENGYVLEFVGLENYRHAFFSDTTYVQTLMGGIQTLVFNIPAIVIFSLFMAVLLNQKMVGRAAFRAILFVPVILCTGLVDKMDAANAMLNSMGSDAGIDTGATEGAADGASRLISAMDVAVLFEGMKVGQGLVRYVTELVNGVYEIINQSGVQMLIFLAGLQSISPAIYESCDIDGASAWEAFWKITIPMVSPMILVNAVYTIIDALTSSTNTVMTYIADIYNTAGGHELSAAMSWVYFLIVIAIIAVVAGLLSLFIFYQRRD